jgi:hypothetical protein
MSREKQLEILYAKAVAFICDASIHIPDEHFDAAEAVVSEFCNAMGYDKYTYERDALTIDLIQLDPLVAGGSAYEANEEFLKQAQRSTDDAD